MPYINGFERNRFENLVRGMSAVDINNAGELNYLITQLVHTFLAQHDQRYQDYNDSLGALEGAKLELYRRYVSKYEDYKIEVNGDVP